jgi:phosphoglycolate phosphatase
MKYQHIIWDWNGTLLNDAWLVVEIFNDMLTLRDLPRISAEQYAEKFGFPVKGYYQKVGFDFEREPFEKLGDEFIEEYERRKLECPLQEGAVEILSENAGKGISQSIISAAKQDSLEEMVKRHGIEHLFVAAHGLDDHYAFGKVDIGLKWMAELNLPPGEILMIGDTTHDYEVAEAMGVDCILVVSGHQNRPRLEACGARVVDSLAELGF